MLIRKIKRALKLKPNGFTLIELLVISPMLILMVTAIISLMVNLVSETTISNSRSTQVADTGTALAAIEETVTLSSGFLPQKEVHLPDPYGADNGGAVISYKGTSAGVRALLTRTYATSTSPKDSAKTPVYINQNGCTQDVIGTNPVLTTNIIYFVRDGNLYRRTLTDTSKTLCSAMFQKHSCPSDAGVQQTICKGNDTLLLTGVTKFDVQYFAKSTDDTPMDVYTSTDPDILDAAETITVTLESNQLSAGETIVYTSTITISRIHV